MDNKAVKLIRLLYGIAVSVMIGISGLLLIAACLQIYQSGGAQIYTPEKVAASFAPIAPYIYITLALIAGAFLLAWVLPSEKKRPTVQKQPALALQKAYAKVDLQLCEATLLQNIQKEQRNRRAVVICGIVTWICCGIVFLLQACNSGNYSPELHLATDSVVAIVWWLLPCTLIPVGYSIFCTYFCRSSARRELELLKLAPKVAAPLPQTTKDKLLYIWLALLVLAVGMIAGGYLAGGMADVLAKAVAICTECVGLG